jgi:hypothetical protein
VKTISLKKVAVVAVASLGFGLVSVAPANAATGDLTGKVICTSSSTAVDATTVAAATASTSNAPATFTVVAGSTFKCTVGQDTDYEAVTAVAYSGSDFTTALTGSTWDATVASGSATTTDPTTAAAVYSDAAPAVDGTYYLKISETGTTSAFIKVTVINMGAALGDGYSSTSGTATAASATKATLSGVAGPANTVTVTAVNQASGGIDGLITVSGAGAKIASGGTVAADYLSTRLNDTGSLTTTSVLVSTPTAGTVTINYYEEVSAGAGIFSTTASSTVTVTVNATALVGVYSATNTTSFLSNDQSAAESTADDTVLASASVSATAIARIDVTLKDGSSAALTSKTLSASVTGQALISNASDGTAKAQVAVLTTHSSTGVATLYIYGTGVGGTAAVTIKDAAGTTITTKNVGTYGSVASLTATVAKNVTSGGTESNAITVLAKDSNGNVVPSQGITLTSGDTTKIATFTATSSSAAEVLAGTASVGVTSISSAYGAVTLTITDTATGLIKTTATVNVGADEAAAVTVAFDKATYAPGEKMILSISAKDANAAAVGDSTTASSLSIVSSLSVQGTIPTATAFVLGKQDITLYAPATQGTFTVSVKLSSGSAWATALDDTTVTATAKVVDTNQTSIMTQIDALNAKIVALNALIAKIMKKLGVR